MGTGTLTVVNKAKGTCVVVRLDHPSVKHIRSYNDVNRSRSGDRAAGVGSVSESADAPTNIGPEGGCYVIRAG